MQNEGVEHSFAASNAPFLLTMLCKVFVCQIWWFTWLENNNQILRGCLFENGKWLNGFSVPHSLCPDLRESESKHKPWVCSRYASHPRTAFISKSGRATVEDETCLIWDSTDQGAEGWALHPKTPQACTCFWAQMFVRIFSFFLASLHGMWDLSSLTRDRTWAPCSRNVKS